jgi:hypothetical protein
MRAGQFTARNSLILCMVLAMVTACSSAPDPSLGGNSDGGASDALPSTNEEAFPVTWQLEHAANVPGVPNAILAPDVQLMDDGRYRMYYTTTGQGVGSASSEDGQSWTEDSGLRITSKRVEGELGFDYGHPWLVRLSDGRWRMYMQASSGIDAPLRVVSATSEDGLNFDIEDGIRLDIDTPTTNDESVNLSFAGHGRAWQHDDGSWGMVFSGNLAGDTNPSDIMEAKSADGLQWSVVESSLFNNGHDPALIRLTDGRLAIVFTYLKDKLQYAILDEKTGWSEAQDLKLLDVDGNVLNEIHGDVALLRRKDGGLRMMSNATHSITSFVPVL